MVPFDPQWKFKSILMSCFFFQKSLPRLPSENRTAFGTKFRQNSPTCPPQQHVNNYIIYSQIYETDTWGLIVAVMCACVRCQCKTGTPFNQCFLFSKMRSTVQFGVTNVFFKISRKLPIQGSPLNEWKILFSHWLPSRWMVWRALRFQQQTRPASHTVLSRPNE